MSTATLGISVASREGSVMGWSYRKSYKVGPVRVNLSKRGVGISAGVKGARISTGPSGTRFYGGFGPFRYIKTLGSGRGQSANNSSSIISSIAALGCLSIVVIGGVVVICCSVLVSDLATSTTKTKTPISNQTQAASVPLLTRSEPTPAPASVPAPSQPIPSTVPPKSISPEYRTWTDDSGKHTTEAAFVSYVGGVVTLNKRDGTQITLLALRLSKPDQQWLQSHQSQSGADQRTATVEKEKPLASVDIGNAPVSAATEARVGSSYTPSTRVSSGSGEVHVKGYYRKDGTYVQPHTRSRPRK